MPMMKYFTLTQIPLAYIRIFGGLKFREKNSKHKFFFWKEKYFIIIFLYVSHLNARDVWSRGDLYKNPFFLISVEVSPINGKGVWKNKKIQKTKFYRSYKIRKIFRPAFLFSKCDRKIFKIKYFFFWSEEEQEKKCMCKKKQKCQGQTFRTFSYRWATCKKYTQKKVSKVGKIIFKVVKKTFPRFMSLFSNFDFKFGATFWVTQYLSHRRWTKSDSGWAKFHPGWEALNCGIIS